MNGFIQSLFERMPGSWQLQPGKALAFGHTNETDLPTCNLARENEHRFIRGGTGVADREVVCAKDDTDTYSWEDRGNIGHDHDADYVNVSGDVMTGDLTLAHWLNVTEDTGAWAGLILDGKTDGGSLDFYKDSVYQGSLYTMADGTMRLCIGSSCTDVMTIATSGVTTFSGDVIVPDEAYGVGWNASTEVPTKNAVYDKVESILAAGGYSDEAALDAVGGALVAGNNIDITVDDGANTITIAVETLTPADIGVDADLATFSLPASTTISAFGATLVDDADAAAGRTTLGLVAGGTGDIWVEKTGDTMTGALGIGATYPYLALNDTDAPADEKATLFVSNDGLIEIQSRNDISTLEDSAISFNRNGYIFDTTILNPNARDHDVIVRGDADNNLIHTDASTDRVGIGTGTPAQKLHVAGILRVDDLSGSGDRLLSANSNGDLQDTAVLDNIQDVVITSPQAGEVLTYSGSVWANNEPAQGIITLDDRTHVYDSQFGTTGTGNTNFDTPGQLAIDSTGRILVVDVNNNRLKIHTDTGTYVTSVSLTGITGVCVDTSDNIYICRGAVYTKYDSSLSLQWTQTSPFTTFVHATTDDTHLYLTAPTSTYIWKFLCSTGDYVADWGTHGTSNGKFSSPVGIAVNDDYLYVADTGNDRIQVTTKTGAFITKWGITGSDPGEFQSPYGLAWNPVTEHLFVTDSLRNDVQEFTFEGGYIGYFPEALDVSGALVDPSGVAVTTDGGSAWVADSSNDNLKKFNESVATETAISIAMNPEDFIVANDPTSSGQAYISLITPAKSIAALEDVTFTAEQLGDLLVFNGSQWVNYPSGSLPIGMVLLSVTTPSASSSHSVSVFSATYDEYLITYSNMVMSTTADLTLRMRVGGTDASGASTYFTASGYTSTGVGLLQNGQTGRTSAAIHSSGSVTALKMSGTIAIHNPFSSAQTLMEHSDSTLYSLGLFFQSGGSAHINTTSYTGFTLIPSAGTITGTVRVYGWRSA